MTGGFNLGGGTENDAIFHTNTYTFGDDLTMIRGDASVRVGRAASRSGIRCRRRTSDRRARTPSTAASPGIGLADFLIGRPFLLQQSAPNTLDMKQKYFGLYGAGHVEAVAAR